MRLVVVLLALVPLDAYAKKPPEEVVQETHPPEIPRAFVQGLDRARMFLVEPFDYVRIDTVPNDAMTYEHALLSPQGDLEIRFAIRPLDEDLRRYEELAKDPNVVAIHPNRLYEGLFQVTALNVGGDAVTSPATRFAKEAVQSEFRAEWGAVQNLGPAPRFTHGKWAHCILVALHRDDLADAYVFFLYNDKAVADRELPLSMRALTFMDPLPVVEVEGGEGY